MFIPVPSLTLLIHAFPSQFAASLHFEIFLCLKQKCETCLKQTINFQSILWTNVRGFGQEKGPKRQLTKQTWASRILSFLGEINPFFILSPLRKTVRCLYSFSTPKNKFLFSVFKSPNRTQQHFFDPWSFALAAKKKRGSGFDDTRILSPFVPSSSSLSPL